MHSLPNYMIRLFVCLLLTMAGSAQAGSADAVIRGKTESGRTAVEVRVGDIDGLIRSIKLTIDGESYFINDAEGSSQSVIRDAENGVYFITLRADGRTFHLWMIPGSEKNIKKGNGFYHSTFAAFIEATDTRKDKSGDFTPRITIGCTLDYEI